MISRSRVVARARGGEVIVSDSVVEAVKGSPHLAFEELGLRAGDDHGAALGHGAGTRPDAEAGAAPRAPPPDVDRRSGQEETEGGGSMAGREARRVAAILLVVATVASYVPARRGMQMAPVDALRMN